MAGQPKRPVRKKVLEIAENQISLYGYNFTKSCGEGYTDGSAKEVDGQLVIGGLAVTPSNSGGGAYKFRFGWRGRMRESVSFPGVLKIGLAGLTATLLLSVQVKISAQQSNAASAGPSPASN